MLHVQVPVAAMRVATRMSPCTFGPGPTWSLWTTVMSPRAEIAAVPYGQSLRVQSPGTRAELDCQPVAVGAMVQIRGAPPGQATTYSSEPSPASSDGGSLPLAPELITCHPAAVCCAK